MDANLPLDELELLYIRDALKDYCKAVHYQSLRCAVGTFGRDSLEAKIIRLQELLRRIEALCPHLQSA